MSSEQKYLEALAKRAQEILESESKLKTTKPKAKKEMDAETKAKVLLNLQEGRKKAAEVRNMKKQIQAKQKQEKIEEFESLKVKYGITSAKPIEKKPEPPRRQRADVVPYEPENIKEPTHETHEPIKEEVKVASKPVDIPKPEVKVEKPIEIIQNSVPSVPTIQKPRYFKPTLQFVKRYGSLYS
jgi:hypothetical protein